MDYNKKQRLIIFAVLAAFLGGCLIFVVVVNLAVLWGLPPVAFNFPLSKNETRYSDSSHIYEYDLATKRVTPHFIDRLEWLDADMAARLVLGRRGDAIVELDLTNDSIRELGPASYQNQPLEFVRRRPGTEDYCGITEGGKLVLWDQADHDFVLLKTIDWNGFSFSCSWSGDGQKCFIPDEIGIAYIDMDTLEETHWLTLPAYFPKPSVDYLYYKNAFSVSSDQNTVVYCTEEEKLMLATVSEDGSIIKEVELGEFKGDCAFTILDNDTVIFVCSKIDPFLFMHSEYEIRLYREGALRKVKKTDWANNAGSGTYVFW